MNHSHPPSKRSHGKSVTSSGPTNEIFCSRARTSFARNPSNGALAYKSCLSGETEIARLDHFQRALRVDEHTDSWVIAAGGFDLLDGEALMHGAMSFPKDELRLADSRRGIAPVRLEWIPHNHVRFGVVAELDPRVAAEVLIREEQNLVSLLQRPGHGLPRSHVAPRLLVHVQEQVLDVEVTATAPASASRGWRHSSRRMRTIRPRPSGMFCSPKSRRLRAASPSTTTSRW